MTALLIRDIPSELHEQLKQLAQQNRRSLSEEAIKLMMEALAVQSSRSRSLPQPYVGAFPLTDEWLNQAKSEGRA